ncbi:MAG: 3-oxoacyl-ACP reductase FabG [Nitrospirales bacterium]|nr:3-oxoacyl-ACP reductase FabG [Nitrospirales bacterium]
MLLENKKALITGGTGALGERLCEVFADEGADVAFSYLKNSEKAGIVVESIKNRGRKGIAVPCSVTDASGIERMVGQVIEEFGRIDILVNNAGATQVLPFPLIEQEDWEEMMSVNVTGTFLVTKEVVRTMVARKSGVVINVGSIAGIRMLEVPVHYATAKAAICGFTISLARELSRYNIRVNCVIPGMLDSGVSRNVPEKQYQEYLRYCSAGRPGKPEEVASLAAFLSSDRAAYINGQNIVIDGGL